MGFTSFLVGCGLTFAFFSLVWRVISSPLKHIPGPFWAQFSDVHRLFDVFFASQIKNQRKLHEQYGPAVRVGPNLVSLSDPNLIKTVYSTRGNFIKSDFYTVNDAIGPDGSIIQNVFGTRSNAFHGKYMKPIQKHYTMTSMIGLESSITSTLTSLCQNLESRFIDSPKNTCDIGDWIDYYTWDVIGQITFSNPFGFLSQATDVGGMISTAESVMHYFGIVGQFPSLDAFLGKNPYIGQFFPTFSVAVNFCLERLGQRLSGGEKEKTKQDMLNQFLHAKEEFPGTVGDGEVIGYLLLNMLAGADTTAITLKAILYHVLTNPYVFSKLRKEIDEAGLIRPGKPTVNYAEAKDLPYLDAVIKEGLRIHPSVGTLLERVVPHQGMELPDGRRLPPGTIVGMNPWVMARNESVYGSDVDAFRPERWLRDEKAGESEEDFTNRRKRMEALDFSFGAGNRVCVGKNLAIIELFKVVPTLVGRYEMRILDPRAWKVHDWWFTFAHGVRVEVSRREGVRPVGEKVEGVEWPISEAMKEKMEPVVMVERVEA